jgi:hypothetical protein
MPERGNREKPPTNGESSQGELYASKAEYYAAHPERWPQDKIIYEQRRSEAAEEEEFLQEQALAAGRTAELGVVDPVQAGLEQLAHEGNRVAAAVLGYAYKLDEQPTAEQVAQVENVLAGNWLPHQEPVADSIERPPMQLNRINGYNPNKGLSVNTDRGKVYIPLPADMTKAVLDNWYMQDPGGLHDWAQAQINNGNYIPA